MYTFSRQISQRLLELGIDIPDSGLWWIRTIGYWTLVTSKIKESDFSHCVSIPALSLSNLITLLPVIGEKLNEINGYVEMGNLFECNNCKSNRTYDCPLSHCTCPDTIGEGIARKITDIFLTSKSEDQAYKLASEYILKLIK